MHVLTCISVDVPAIACITSSHQINAPLAQMGKQVAINPTYEVSDYVDPVETLKRGKPKSPFRKSIEGMPVGKAVIVTGMSPADACSRANVIGKKMAPKRQFSTGRLPDGRVQIARIF